ncbi:MAG: response regulator [Deltaproteobacteria bacterium]|nr:response regulator [Deltaproteobacteria bacterium]
MCKNILVVDNNPVILKLMANFLGKSGYLVKTAIGGLEAIKIIKTFQPEVIFLDIIMPKISGEKLCKMLRKMPKMAGVAIIMLSAAALEQKIDFKSFGADACIAKGPFKGVEKHINFVLQKILAGQLTDLAGKIIGGEDVYERVITTELLLNREHFEVTLINMAEGFVELTGDGRIVYVNQKAADLFGCPEEKLLAVDFTSLFSGSKRDDITAALINLGDKRRVIGETSPFIVNNRYLAMTIAGIARQDSVIIIIQDITARKRAEQELQKYREHLEETVRRRTAKLAAKNRELEDEIAERRQLAHEKMALKKELGQTRKMEALGTMATGIAHDFNNILTAMLGYVSLLRLDAGGNSQVLSSLDHITKAGSQAKELIGLIKTFSKPVEQEFSLVRLPLLIGETLALLRPSVPPDIKVVTHVDPQCPAVWADAVQLQRVIVNLCTNAIHAIPKSGGVLTITLSQEKQDIDVSGETQNSVKLAFSDTGEGISPANLEKIFDPYFTTREEGEGTGLGLSVVHGIITNHKGRVQAESVQGQGATFTVTLPAYGGA